MADEQSIVPKSVGAILGGLAGIPFGPLGPVVGGAVGLAVEQVANRLLLHSRQRADQLGSELEQIGVTADALSVLLEDPRGELLVLRAISAAATTTNDVHIRSLAEAIKSALFEDELALAEVQVETLGRMTDADMIVLTLIRDSIGADQTFQQGYPPQGAPNAMVDRLMGLGLLTFDGLHMGLNDLARLILGS